MFGHGDRFPHASGLQEIYQVIDQASGGRLDGPSRVPMDILGPLLNELSSLGVEELSTPGENCAVLDGRKVSTSVRDGVVGR